MIISTWSFVLYFIVYVLIHVGIGYKLEKIKKELEIKPGNIALMSSGKKLNILFKWFPAIYIVFIGIMFYVF